MRTAAVCPTCATYINSNCVLYTGNYLTTLNISNLETLTSSLIKIEEWATLMQQCCAEEGGVVDYSKVILKINNMAVNKEGRTDYANIEVGDLIDGEYPVGSNRYIRARVTALPWNISNSDTNLQIISIDQP